MSGPGKGQPTPGNSATQSPTGYRVRLFQLEHLFGHLGDGVAHDNAAIALIFRDGKNLAADP